jgi:hypothetical protein
MLMLDCIEHQLLTLPHLLLLGRKGKTYRVAKSVEERHSQNVVIRPFP